MFCDGEHYWTMKQILKEINLNIEIYTMKDHIPGVPEITEFLEETGFEFLFTYVKIIYKSIFFYKWFKFCRPQRSYNSDVFSTQRAYLI